MERKLVWVCGPFIMETEPNLVDCPGLSLRPSVQEPRQCLQQGQGPDVQVIDKAFSLLSCGSCWRRTASCSLFIVHCTFIYLIYIYLIYLYNVSI